ncbi:MAG: DUF2075 domain-containing protein [Candidatus Hydrogenedentota bacterium]|nr:MAG: DUF2075 domain-containing protein [Candidatus Hydrogenedentota bacterium]
MYKEFFHLVDEPFRMTPDTRYLFRSRRHEEAISSLLYGIGEKKGFIVITGEIGTGKTTLCRALLNQLDPHTKTAIILNPSLSASELLHAIVDDLGIELKKKEPTQKELMDTLNAFLIEQARAGGNVAVIIDEAQNLDVNVLEFIRMLSNLETEQEKLLQLILVGQPELNEILKMDRLEQLRQRIAVRYHITPLERDEIPEYIRHRLKIAGNERAVSFEKGAVDAIAEYTGGTPRLINIICDKCLLAAYALETKTVTEAIARKAIVDHEGPVYRPTSERRQRAAASLGAAEIGEESWEEDRIPDAAVSPSRPGNIVGGVLLGVLAAGIVLVILHSAGLRGRVDEQRRLPRSPAVATPASPSKKDSTKSVWTEKAVEKSTEPEVVTAAGEVLRLWGADPKAKNFAEAGMAAVPVMTDLPTLAAINLPALIKVLDKQEKEVALVGVTPTSYEFYRGGEGGSEPIVRYPRVTLDREGLVNARIPLPANFAFTTASPADPRLSKMLDDALERLGVVVPWKNRRREPLARRVLRFQSAAGLPVDGVVGPLTWCALVSYSHPEYPSLRK